MALSRRSFSSSSADDVSYDASYGFPRVTYIDYDQFYTDDDLQFDVRELRVIR